MFAGKTSELLREEYKVIATKYSPKPKKYIIIKYSGDNRYSSNHVVTHNGVKTNAINATKLMDVFNKVSKYDIIMIDEGQFFDDIVEFSNLLADKGKQIIVSALDGDYKQEPFGMIHKLIPYSEEVIKISAICFNCGDNAHFTKRISNETNTIQIGGSDKYKAVCRICLQKLKNNTKSSNQTSVSNCTTPSNQTSVSNCTTSLTPVNHN